MRLEDFQSETQALVLGKSLYQRTRQRVAEGTSFWPEGSVLGLPSRLLCQESLVININIMQ